MDAYPWPDPENGEYYWPLKEAVACLPPGMGLVSGVGGIFSAPGCCWGWNNSVSPWLNSRT